MTKAHCNNRFHWLQNCDQFIFHKVVQCVMTCFMIT